MQRFAFTTLATAAIFAALSMSAFAQSALTKCEVGEGQVLEYDFAKHYIDDKVTLESMFPLRLASSNCVPGQPSKTWFRGVGAEFENMTQAQKAIGAAHVLISLGITDLAVIEQLIARVQSGIRQVEGQRPGVTYKATIFIAEVEQK